MARICQSGDKKNIEWCHHYRTLVSIRLFPYTKRCWLKWQQQLLLCKQRSLTVGSCVPISIQMIQFLIDLMAPTGGYLIFSPFFECVLELNRKKAIMSRKLLFKFHTHSCHLGISKLQIEIQGTYINRIVCGALFWPLPYYYYISRINLN